MISKSPDRNTFQKNGYLSRMADKEQTPDNDANVAAMFEYYSNLNNIKMEREADPEWQKNNLEYDLRTTEWILEKVRASEPYAQNLYAAMCNRSFVRNDVWPILKQEQWSCSWRYAGGIVADMRQGGDYIDWYCSGIRDVEEEPYGYVPESVVTEEIQEDLLRLGWLVLDDKE